MTFSEFLAAVRCYWLTFAVMVAVVFGSALAWLLLARDQYVSTAQVLVSLQGSTTAEIYQSDDAIQSRINSYIALLSTDVVSQRVVDKLGLQMPAHGLASRISAVKVPPNTALIDIAVTDHSPERARQLTQTVAEEFVGYANALETPSGEGAQKVQSSVVTPAGEAVHQIGKRLALGGVAALASILAGAIAVWIRAKPAKRAPPMKAKSARAGAFVASRRGQRGQGG